MFGSGETMQGAPLVRGVLPKSVGAFEGTFGSARIGSGGKSVIGAGPPASMGGGGGLSGGGGRSTLPASRVVVIAFPLSGFGALLGVIPAQLARISRRPYQALRRPAHVRWANSKKE